MVVSPDFVIVPYLNFQEVGPAMSVFWSVCLSFLVVCELIHVLTMYLLTQCFRFPRWLGSMLSSVASAAVKEVGSVVTWETIQNFSELHGFRCFPEDSDACIGSVVTWGNE